MLANSGSDYEVTQTTENAEVQISQGHFALRIGLWLKFKWKLHQNLFNVVPEGNGWPWSLPL